MWIVSQIIDNGEEINAHQRSIDDEDVLDDDWDDIDLEHLEEDMDQAMYMVNVKINGSGRFPEIGFKAGINDRDDIAYFFDMVLEMLDKLD